MSFKIKNTKYIVYNNTLQFSDMILTIIDNVKIDNYKKVNVRSLPNKLIIYRGTVMLRPDGYRYKLDLIERAIQTLKSFAGSGDNIEIAVLFPDVAYDDGKYLPAIVVAETGQSILVAPVKGEPLLKHNGAEKNE